MRSNIVVHHIRHAPPLCSVTALAGATQYTTQAKSSANDPPPHAIVLHSNNRLIDQSTQYPFNIPRAVFTQFYST